MSFWPKSRTARRRLTILLSIAPVLILAVGLTLYGLRNKISLFLMPSQVADANPAPGRRVDIGGLVGMGSIVKYPDGRITFTVTDNTPAVVKATFKGATPDLFEEGKGVVASGYFNADGSFTATTIAAKHDEQYMPQTVKKQLEKQGEWRPAQNAASVAGRGKTS
ncbi:MAG: cytochrome c maturation protein CcmE [Caulobacteraceae bacterium]|nr:cytochrome c maturation protein CcmE [Caulobacteraceae bacterium]